MFFLDVDIYETILMVFWPQQQQCTNNVSWPNHSRRIATDLCIV